MEKYIWFDAREISPSDTEILPLVSSSGIDMIVVRSEDVESYKMPSNIHYAVEVSNKDELEHLNREFVILSQDQSILNEARSMLFKTCAELAVNDKESLEKSWKIGIHYDYVIIEFHSETNIPLELVIARLQKSKTVLLKKVDKAVDAEIAFGVMEQGSDGVLFTTDKIEEMIAMRKVLDKANSFKMDMVEGIVKKIEHIGMGARVCVDTTSLLRQDEGMVIGSTSHGGILVSSETHFLPYMNLRPFRVNAGAVHSYIWGSDNSTWYLTELESGNKVVTVDHSGNAREVSVGRVKIEVRPLLKITVEANGIELNTIVQDDWHIRVIGYNGEPYNASSLKAGDKLAAYISKPGRHVGINIDETIIEK